MGVIPVHDKHRAIAVVEEFCSQRVQAAIRVTVVDDLPYAVRAAALRGPDQRWRTLHSHNDPDDLPPSSTPMAGAAVDRQILTATVTAEIPGPQRKPPWFLRHTVTSTAHWARFSTSLRTARDHGVGWLIPVHGEVLVVPRPTVRCAEGQPDVIHDDTGRMAIEWPRGVGYHCLNGAVFPPKTYHKTVGNSLSLAEIAALPNADQRSIALSYLTFDRLVRQAGATLIDRGSKGTLLYRLRLPLSIARDRPRGYGEFDYFIHMRDASHPEREFIEWVDPAVGAQGNAELCQAHAFGISLHDWLSIEQEG